MGDNNKIVIWREDVNKANLKGVGHINVFSKRTMNVYIKEREDPNDIFVEVELVPTGRKVEDVFE